MKLSGHGLSLLQCGLHLLGDPSPVHSHHPTRTEAETSEVTKEGRTSVVVVGVHMVTSALHALQQLRHYCMGRSNSGCVQLVVLSYIQIQMYFTCRYRHTTVMQGWSYTILWYSYNYCVHINCVYLCKAANCRCSHSCCLQGQMLSSPTWLVFLGGTG